MELKTLTRNIATVWNLFASIRLYVIDSSKMKNVLIVFLIVLVNQVFWIDGAPNALDSATKNYLNESIVADNPVRYDGAQLWKVDFNDDRTKTIVVELKRAYGSFS